jgi:hypothetical protein
VGSGSLALGTPPLNAAKPALAERVIAFLRAVDERLETNPEDDGTRLLAVREYLRMGLGAAAAELLSSAGPSLTGTAEFAELRALAARQTRIVAWDRRAKRFERNLAPLAARGIAVDDIRAAWSAGQTAYELHLDSSGGEQVRGRLPGGCRRWLRLGPSPVAMAESAPLPVDAEALMPGPYLFESLGLPEYLLRIWRRTRNTFHGYDAAIYVVESNLTALGLALNLCDLSEPLADDAVMLFGGADCRERFRRTIEADPNLPPPRQCFDFSHLCRSHDGAAHACPRGEALLEAMKSARHGRLVTALAGLEATYAGRDARYWARRFEAALSGAGPPLRVLATVSTRTTYLQYSMRDALDALETLGCQTRLLIETRRFEIVSAEAYHQVIGDFDPDLVFVIDHPRSSFGGRVPRNLPIMTWDQDALPHIFTPANLGQMGPLDVLVGLPHVPEIVNYGLDAAQFFVSQAATNPQRFDIGELTDEERARYACDISYVSHASQTPADFHAQERQLYREANAEKLLDALYKLATDHVLERGSVDEGDLARLLLAGEQATGIHVPQTPMRERLMTWYLWRLCDRVFRHQALEWAARFAERTGRTLRIYGNGWDKHPTLARWAHGAAANGRELACVHRGSRINLQLMPAGFLHQRAMDGLCAGGFFLVRATPADERDPRVLRIQAALECGSFTSGADLLSRAAPAVKEDFLGMGRRIGRAPAACEVTFQWIRSQRQIDYPHEVFARFREIVFADEAGFSAAAEHFLAAEAARRELTAEMQRVVIERYSYRATLDKFLRFFMGFLRDRAAAT